MNQANWNDILGKAKEFGKAVGDVAEILLPTGHTLRLKVREITRTQHHA